MPHDWAIELPFGIEKGRTRNWRSMGFARSGRGIRRTAWDGIGGNLRFRRSDLGRRIGIEFDGVFRSSIVWVNGFRMGRHESGYTSFRYDVTDVLEYGGKNVVVVRVDATDWEGWWYEGAGIYRHVWLVKTDPLHVRGGWGFCDERGWKGAATVTVRTRVVNDGEEEARVDLDLSRVCGGKGAVVEVGIKTAGCGRLRTGWNWWHSCGSISRGSGRARAEFVSGAKRE